MGRHNERKEIKGKIVGREKENGESDDWKDKVREKGNRKLTFA